MQKKGWGNTRTCGWASAEGIADTCRAQPSWSGQRWGASICASMVVGVERGLVKLYIPFFRRPNQPGHSTPARVEIRGLYLISADQAPNSGPSRTVTAELYLIGAD